MGQEDVVDNIMGTRGLWVGGVRVARKCARPTNESAGVAVGCILRRWMARIVCI